MAKRSRKLPAFGGFARCLVNLGDYYRSGDEKAISLFTIDWRKIQRAYGQPLSADVQEALVAATRSFVLFEESERTGETVADVQKTIEACKRGASKFQNGLPSLESVPESYDAQFFISKNEIDNLFANKTPEVADVKALINGGYRRGAFVGRCVVRGKVVETEELPSFAAVALAGIGNLPDTVSTRTIHIEMLRRAPDEHVEPFRMREQKDPAQALQKRLAVAASRWVSCQNPRRLLSGGQVGACPRFRCVPCAAR
jgi:hypothetical protein